VIDKVTVEDWEECVRHAERLHGQDFVTERSRDSNINSDSEEELESLHGYCACVLFIACNMAHNCSQQQL
jgi:hypothetical protein